jgi:hypothetical protein
MNKKDLKFYEAPACEVMELELSQILCASPDDSQTNPFSGNTEEPEEV